LNIKRATRPSANATRQTILKVASQLFMRNGFAGTSMAKLAEIAGLNQTLIFHHFGNKQQLWQAVKVYILAKVKVPSLATEPSCLKQFLAEAIEQRITIYRSCPKLKTLVAWEKLASNGNKQLSGVNNSFMSPEQWTIAIAYLQAQGMIKSNIKPLLLMIWLVASIDGLLNDDLRLFKHHQSNQKAYITMLIDSLAIGLAGHYDN
jgi:AcrR family transcriptional regulator